MTKKGNRPQATCSLDRHTRHWQSHLALGSHTRHREHVATIPVLGINIRTTTAVGSHSYSSATHPVEA